MPYGRHWGVLGVLLAAGCGGSGTTFHGSPGGGGGAGGAAVAASSTEAATGGAGVGGNVYVECSHDSDCPGVADECGAPACTESGDCAMAYAPAGTPVAAQVPGDCKVQVCDGAGRPHTEADDFDDDFDDGVDCYAVDHCNGTKPVMKPRASGEACSAGGRMCNGFGACVDCVAAKDCGDPTVAECMAGGFCHCPSGPEWGTPNFDMYCDPGSHAEFCGSATAGPAACENLTAGGMWCCPW